MDLSIIIVSWNVCSDVVECLQSVFASSSTMSFDVWVADNGSTDGTVSMIRERFPQVHLVENGKNLGFPKANNVAISMCAGDRILLLNPDTVVPPDAFSRCIAYMRRHPKVGILGARLMSQNGRTQFEGAGNFPSLGCMIPEAMYLHMCFPRNRVFGHTRMSYWDHLDDRPVPCIAGAFMMVSREFVEHVGLMDETVPMYLEDADWCFRAGKSGFEVHYLGSVGIIHKAGQSTAKARSRRRRVWLAAQARERFFRKHYGRVAAVLCRVLLLWRGVFRLAVSFAVWPIRSWFESRPDFASVADPEIHYAQLEWALGLRRRDIWVEDA